MRELKIIFDEKIIREFMRYARIFKITKGAGGDNTLSIPFFFQMHL